jgi:mono/diheme cytochrome c family protein
MPEPVPNSIMPALGMALGAGADESSLNYLVEYVLSLFAMFCASCHGAQGGVTAALGAPDLSDLVWLYGDAEAEAAAASVRDVVVSGRANSMPAFGWVLTPIQTLVGFLARGD